MAGLSVEDVVRGTQGALVAGDLGVPVTGVSIDSRNAGHRRGLLRDPGPRSRRPRLPAATRPRAGRLVPGRPRPARRPAAVGADGPGGRHHRALGRLARLSPRALHGPGRGGHRLQRQDHHQGDDGRGAAGARAGAQARGQLQQPVGAAAHPAPPRPRAPGASRSSWAPTPRARSSRSPRSAGPRSAWSRWCRAPTPRPSAIARRGGQPRRARSSARSRPTARWCSTRTIRGCSRCASRAAARVLYYSTRAAAPTSTRRAPPPTRATGSGSPSRSAPRSARCACSSRAATTSPTRSPRRGWASPSASRSSRSRAGLEAARPAKGRCVWRPAGRLAHPRRHLQRQSRPRWRAALETLAAPPDARRRVVVLGDMLELGDDQRGRAPRDGPRGGRLRRGRVPRDGPLGARRGGGGAARPGSRRAIT